MKDKQSVFDQLRRALPASPRHWLVTGAAGFIGSHLVETLLRLNQRVTGIDNFATGHQRNLNELLALVTSTQRRRFVMIKGDIRKPTLCRKSCQGVDFVLHQAALGSVPRSIDNPLDSHENNVTGFINMLTAAKEGGVKRFVYASSSAVYGDDPRLPKKEERTGKCLSPYAATKATNEVYAEVFARCYGMETIGLRYFNVFGPRQDPNGPYAAVIPKWVTAMIRKEPIYINGDGETSRDFCYVANVVQANLLSATATLPEAINQVYNVALHAHTSLNELFQLLLKRLLPRYPHLRKFKPKYRDFRSGDVRHSEADIRKIKRLLGYAPTHRIDQGLDDALEWYCQNLT